MSIQPTSSDILAHEMPRRSSKQTPSEDQKAPQKWIEVHKTVARIMRSLPELQKYQVITFSDRTHFPLGGDGKFNWNIVTQGKTQPIAGTYVFENDVLTLTQSENNAMVGKVAWQDESHFKFQAMGGGPNDPGLAFSK